MTITTPTRRQTQLVPRPRLVPTGRRLQPQVSRKSRKVSAYSNILYRLSASLAGGVGLQTLLLIGLIPASEHLPSFSLSILLIPGVIVTCLATGLLAAISAEDDIRHSLQGGKAGWIGGFWAGVFSGLGAMYLAANGVLMVDFGQSIVAQFSPEQLEGLHAFGLLEDTVARAGRVLGALIVYGVLGSLMIALLSSVGGLVYSKLSGD